MASFEDQCSQVIARLRRDFLKTFRKASKQVFKRAVSLCPVRTGRLQYSLYLDATVSVFLPPVPSGSPRTRVFPKPRVPKDSDLSLSPIYFIGSNVPYASGIEYQGGSPLHAPFGFLRLSLTEFDNFLDAAQRELVNKVYE